MPGSRLKFDVRSTHFTSSHASSPCAHVVCLILRDSPFLFLLSIFPPVVFFIYLVFSFFFQDVEDKSKFACISEASESTRLRMEDSLPNHRENHIAGKEDSSLQHFNLVHKIILMPQAMKIPAAKAVVDKDWEKLETIPAWDLTKVRSKKKR